MNLNKRSGISMIVLVITIIVSLILLSVILLNIENNNPIDSAKEVKFKTDIGNFIDEISITYTNKKTEDVKYKFEEMNVDVAAKDDTTGEYKIREYIPSITDEYVDRFGLKEGQLTYRDVDFSDEEKEWLQQSGAVRLE